MQEDMYRNVDVCRLLILNRTDTPIMKSFDVGEVLSDVSAKSSRNRLLEHLKSSKYGKLKYGQQAKFHFECQPGHKTYAASEEEFQLKKVILEIEEVLNGLISKITEVFLLHQRKNRLLLASVSYIKKVCEIQETILTCLQRFPENVMQDLDMVIENLHNAMEAWRLEMISFETEAASQKYSSSLQTSYPLADLTSIQNSFNSLSNPPAPRSNKITYILYFILNIIMSLLSWDTVRNENQKEQMNLEATDVTEHQEEKRKYELFIERMMENLKDFIDSSAKITKELRLCPLGMFFGSQVTPFLIKYNERRYEMLQHILRVSMSDFEEKEMNTAVLTVDGLENLVSELVQDIGTITFKNEEFEERNEKRDVKLLSWRVPVEAQETHDESLIARKSNLENKQNEEIKDTYVVDLSLWESFYAQKALEKRDEQSRIFAEAKIDDKILAFQTKIQEEENRFAVECKHKEIEAKLRQEDLDRLEAEDLDRLQLEAERRAFEFKEEYDKIWETLMVNFEAELMAKEAETLRRDNLQKEEEENMRIKDLQNVVATANIEVKTTDEEEMSARVPAMRVEKSRQRDSKTEAVILPQSRELAHRDLQEFLRKYEDKVLKLCEDDNTKHVRDNTKKFIQTILNTITPSDSRGFAEKLEKLKQLLSGKSVVDQTNKIFSIPDFLAPFAILTLVEKFLKRGDLNGHETTLMCAKLITSLMSDFSEFEKVMLASFNKTCPYLVPFFPSKFEGQSKEDYYRCRGYHCEGGEIEEPNKFLKRMEAVSRLYFSLFIQPNQNVMPLLNAQEWISLIIKTEPEVDMTATLLNVCLEVCYPKLLQLQSERTIELLTNLAERYLPRIKAVTPEGHGGPIQRLELLLEKNLKGQRR
ncbi:mRNA export factor GLE1-like [Artemia franciscana]